MSRRRYLSTKISQDAKINRLAVQHGDFAALLYTWMIPHAEDDGTLTGDPEELLMTVMPGRRDKDIADIEAALQAMCDLRLIVWERDENAMRISFPESFYNYQTYITDKRRKASEPRNDAPSDAQSSAKQRKTAQNASSLKLKSSFPLKVSSSPSGEDTLNAADDADAHARATTAASNHSNHHGSDNHWTTDGAKRTAEEVARRTRLRTNEIPGLIAYIEACPTLSHEAIIGEAETFVAWLNKSKKAASASVFYNRWLKPAHQELLRQREAAAQLQEKSLSNGHHTITTPEAKPPTDFDILYQANLAQRPKMVS